MRPARAGTPATSTGARETQRTEGGAVREVGQEASPEALMRVPPLRGCAVMVPAAGRVVAAAAAVVAASAHLSSPRRRTSLAIGVLGHVNSPPVRPGGIHPAGCRF